MSEVELFVFFMMLLLTAFWIVQGQPILTVIALLGSVIWYFNHRQR